MNFLVRALKEVGHQTYWFFEKNFYVTFFRILATYAIWILLLPLVLIAMAQGREMFIGMFDENNLFTAVRGASLVGMFVLQSLAMLLVPRPFFPKHGLEVWKKVRPATFNNDGGSPGLLFIISVLPIYAFGLVMIYVQRDRLDDWHEWFFAIGTILASIVLTWQAFQFSRLSFWWNLGVCLGVIALVFVLLWSLRDRQDPFWNYFIVGGGLMAETVFLAGIAREFVKVNFLEPANWPKSKALRRYDRVYLAVFGLSGFLWLAGLAVNNLDVFSPMFVLLVITTFYLLATVNMQTLYVLKIKPAKLLWRVGWWAGWTAFLYFLFIFKSKQHDIHTISSEGAPRLEQRLGMAEYFKGWWHSSLGADTAAAEIPIYLVAAQGGGSRAGIWTSSVMNQLEFSSELKFHKHCFAVTSASGGSAGMGGTLAFWEHMRDRRATLTAGKLDREAEAVFYRRFPRGMFQRNYLSGSFYEMFCNEVLQRFTFVGKNPKDRNYRLQRAEALGFAEAINAGSLPDLDDHAAFNRPRHRISSIFKTGARSTLDVGAQRIPNYPFRPFLSYWYTPGQSKPRYEWPLYLPITTNLSNGKSGYPSPVRLDPANFIDALDILWAVDTMPKRPEQTLSLVAASSLSQLFPLMNAYTFIPGAGNFIDGGTYENFGNSALLEIYQNLRRTIARADYISSETKAKVRFYVLFLVNDEMEDRGYSGGFEEKKRKNQGTAVLGFAGSSSIEGKESYWLDKFHTAVQATRRDTSIEVMLQERGTPDSERIPLGRWLSRRSVDSVAQKLVDIDRQLKFVIQPLK